MAQDASNTNSQPSPGKSVNLTISHASFDSVLSVLENSDPAINVVVLSDPNQPFENNITTKRVTNVTSMKDAMKMPIAQRIHAVST